MQAIKNGEKRGELMSSLLGGTISLTVSTIIVKLLGLIYKIPLASQLGDEGMGYFNSAYTVYSFFYLLCTAGVPKAVMILVSEAKAKGRAIEERNILRVASVLFLSLGAVICAAFIIFSSPIASLIGNSRSAYTMIAIAPSIIFVSLAGVIRGYLSANMLLPDIAISQVIEGLGKLLLGLAFAVLGGRLRLPLEVISALTILGVTLGSAFGLIYLFVCSKIRIRNDKTGQNIRLTDNKGIIKRIFSISVPITFSAAIMSITNIIDLGLIMRSLGEIGLSEAQASALYGNYTTLAVPMFNLAISIISPISVAHLPALTNSFVKGDVNTRVETERSSLELTAILSAPMMIGMAVFSKEILDLLFPKSETELGGALLCLLAPAILFSSLLLTVNTSLEAGGRVKSPLISMIFGSILKIAVSYIIITRTDMGILGAPIGTVVSYATALLVSLIIYGRAFKSHLPIFTSSLCPYLCALVSVLLSRVIYDRLYQVIDKNVLLLGAILFAALVYLGLLAFLGLLSPNKIGKMAKYTKIAR